MATLEEIEDKASILNNNTRPECACCQERYSPRKVIRAECSHFYCTDCLTLLLKKSLLGDSLFPPRCCESPIKVEDTNGLIDPELADAFEKRMVEFQDPDKTYCSVQTCSRYLPPARTQRQRDVGKCRCGEKTCRRCKQKAHEATANCVHHFDNLLENLAKREGWKHCIRCSQLIELNRGCRHIR